MSKMRKIKKKRAKMLEIMRILIFYEYKGRKCLHFLSHKIKPLSV